MAHMIAQTTPTRNRGPLPHKILASKRKGKFCRARHPFVMTGGAQVLFASNECRGVLYLLAFGLLEAKRKQRDDVSWK
jgi:hypothetical protein